MSVGFAYTPWRSFTTSPRLVALSRRLYSVYPLSIHCSKISALLKKIALRGKKCHFLCIAFNISTLRKWCFFIKCHFLEGKRHFSCKKLQMRSEREGAVYTTARRWHRPLYSSTRNSKTTCFTIRKPRFQAVKVACSEGKTSCFTSPLQGDTLLKSITSPNRHHISRLRAKVTLWPKIDHLVSRQNLSFTGITSFR